MKVRTYIPPYFVCLTSRLQLLLIPARIVKHKKWHCQIKQFYLVFYVSHQLLRIKSTDWTGTARYSVRRSVTFGQMLLQSLGITTASVLARFAAALYIWDSYYGKYITYWSSYTMVHKILTPNGHFFLADGGRGHSREISWAGGTLSSPHGLGQGVTVWHGFPTMRPPP